MSSKKQMKDQLQTVYNDMLSKKKVHLNDDSNNHLNEYPYNNYHSNEDSNNNYNLSQQNWFNSHIYQNFLFQNFTYYNGFPGNFYHFLIVKYIYIIANNCNLASRFMNFSPLFPVFNANLKLEEFSIKMEK